MKIDPYSPTMPAMAVKLFAFRGPFGSKSVAAALLLILIALLWVNQPSGSAIEVTSVTDPPSIAPGNVSPTTNGQDHSTAANSGATISPGSQTEPQPPQATEQTQQAAGQLATRVLHQLTHGAAFDAKVRETIWASGREVVGVGTYEQVGQGSGQFNLQITMHDGDGKHRLQQVSDGRLAWTRSEIGDQVTLRRVDVGRLDEWVGSAVGSATKLSPSLKVGAWTEILDTLLRDYQVSVQRAQLESRPVWLLNGELKREIREEMMAETQRKTWPELFPSRLRIAVAAENDPATGFGKWLPIRFEYWSTPLPSSDQQSVDGRLIALIELHSIRPIRASPVQRFQFDNQDAEVNFSNDTDRYIRLYGVELTAKQRRLLRR